MDDEMLEEKIKGVWDPSPPDGMRDRVLAAARVELRTRAKPQRRIAFTWRAGLAAGALAIILCCNLLDNAFMGGASLPRISPNVYRALCQRNVELARALDDSGAQAGTNRQRGWYQ